MTLRDFADSLRARGVELIVRHNQLRVWPAKAFKYFTDAERDFYHTHRAELKALAPSLPETTVVFQPPTAVGLTTELRVAPTDVTDAGSACAYCGQSPCIGPKHPHYRTLHANDPTEIARRSRDATAVMVQRWGRR